MPNTAATIPAAVISRRTNGRTVVSSPVLTALDVWLCPLLFAVLSEDWLFPLLELLPFAKECGVKIATENMWNWDNEKGEACFAACATSESFLEHLHAVDDPSFVACLDLGHAEMKGAGSGAAAMIRALGPKLEALHIHDNDRIHDSHQLPFSMKIDFGEIVSALKEIGYGGYFTLEADAYLKKYAKDDVCKGVKKMAESAKRLAAMFEKESL